MCYPLQLLDVPELILDVRHGVLQPNTSLPVDLLLQQLLRLLWILDVALHLLVSKIGIDQPHLPADLFLHGVLEAVFLDALLLQHLREFARQRHIEVPLHPSLGLVLELLVALGRFDGLLHVREEEFQGAVDLPILSNDDVQTLADFPTSNPIYFSWEPLMALEYLSRYSWILSLLSRIRVIMLLPFRTCSKNSLEIP